MYLCKDDVAAAKSSRHDVRPAAKHQRRCFTAAIIAVPAKHRLNEHYQTYSYQHCSAGRLHSARIQLHYGRLL